MKLAFQHSGSGNTLVILHGLYGSSDNWHSIGRELSTHFEVYLIDQRNHGRSPHVPVHTYESMCSDLYDFLEEHGIVKPVLIGHSMGGKTAMLFAMKHPERVSRLVVVDISPADYRNRDQMRHSLTHEKIVSSLQLIDPALVGSRKEADQMLQQVIPQPAIRQFLLKNLKSREEGGYRWALNLDALANNMDSLAAGILIPGTENLVRVNVPALFVKGEISPYIREEDFSLIKTVFPSSSIITIPGTGHWVHAEEPALFLQTLLEFLQPEWMP